MKKITLLLFILCVGQVLAQSAFTGKPRYEILTRRASSSTYTIGVITIELFPNIAPKHARNFDSLVSTGFYDSTAFHRVVPGFVIQGGDPNSRSGPVSTWGYGDPNQPMVDAEFSVAKHVRGILSAARQAGNINSATSQFFICVAPASNLNGQYSVYGRVTSGMNIVDSIVNSPRNSADMPLQKFDMFVKYIGSNDTVPDAPTLNAPVDQTNNVDTANILTFKWNSVKDAIIYRFELSTDAAFQDSVAFINSPNLQYILPSLKLKEYTTYYWRVRVNNGGHFSDYSDVWTFRTTDDLVSIPTNAATSRQVLVFPNPGNGRFMLSGLEKGNWLEVFDGGGKRIYETLVKDTSLPLDLEGREKGIYIYRLSDGHGEVQQGKLIIK